MKSRLLILSIGLNLAFAGLVCYRWFGPWAMRPPVTARAGRPLSDIPATSSASNLSASVAFVTNRFQWRDLESDKYDEYVANLRAVGCPQTTVRDIIEADVERHYTAVRGHVALEAGFWTCGTKRSAAERRQTEQLRALDAEKKALLVHLLGSDLTPTSAHDRDDLNEQAILRFVLGPLPDGVPEQVSATMAEDELEAGEINEQARNLLLPQDEARLHELHTRTLDRLQKLLDPAQVHEFAARVAAVQLIDGDLQYAHLNAADLRTVAGLHADVFGLLNEPSWRLFDSGNGSDEQKADFEERLKQFLGEDRYSTYQLEKDPDFRNLLSLAESQHLAPDVAQRVYEIKQLAVSEQDRLRQDPSIPTDERLAQLAQMQAGTLASVQVLLGNDGYRAYLAAGGAWLTNGVKP